MKKFLFLLFICMLSMFSLTACDDSGDNTPANPVTKPDMSKPETLQGTYDITFFYTDGAGFAVVTSDCDKIEEYVPGSKTCGEGEGEGSSEYKGEGIIKLLPDNTVKIITKVQLDGGSFSTGIAGAMAPQNRYNITDFNPIPVEAITDSIINDPATGKDVKGAKGRNAFELIKYSNPDATKEDGAASTYQLTIDKDGTIINNMIDKSSVMAAKVVVRMKKRSDLVEEFDLNQPYAKPDLSGKDPNGKPKFDYKVKYNPAQ